MQKFKKRFLWFLAAGVFFISTGEEANAQLFRRWRIRQHYYWNSCDSSQQVWYDAQGRVVRRDDGGCYGDSNPSCYSDAGGDYNRYGATRQSCSSGGCKVDGQDEATCGVPENVPDSGFE